MAKFYLLDADYVTKNNETVIRLFGRTDDGKKICVLDNNFFPYFWVTGKNLTKLAKKISTITVTEDNRIYKVVSTEIHDKNFIGKKVKAIKVSVANPKDIHPILDVLRELEDVDKRTEVDINVAKRYLVDKKLIPLRLCEVKGKEVDSDLAELTIEASSIKPLDEDYKDHKILSFDIETYNGNSNYSSPERDPIISLALAGDKLQKVITWKKFKTDDPSVIFVKDEKELIKKFIEITKDYSPDFLTGYFSDGFDLPYIITRAKEYKIDLDFGSGKTTLRKGGIGGVARTLGVIHIDIFKFIRSIMADSLTTNSYGLDAVAKELANVGKTEDFDKRLLGRAWDQGGKAVEQICDYNLNDAIITLKLTKKIFPNMEELAKIVNQCIFDVSRMTYGQMVEWYLIKEAPEHNELVPNRPSGDRISTRMEETYKGAFVYPPKAGLYEDIVVFDFKSLYPTVIIAHNIGPTTLTNKKVNTIKTPKIGKDIFYFKKERGFVPHSIEKIITSRVKLKQEYKKDKNPLLAARIYGLKTIANASYGYLGFFGSRWYSRECAESITAFSRDYIQKTIELAKKDNFKILYGDTDSIFIHLENKSHEDAKNFLDKINKKLPDPMELELEGFFKRGIFVMKKGEETGAKKKYALLDENDNLKIVGFETIRGDWSILAKKVQKEVLKIVLKDNSPKKALDYVKKIIDKINKGSIPMEDLVIQTQLKKKLSEYKQIGPHVAVAQKMKKAGHYVTTGTLVRYIITDIPGKIRDKALMPEAAQSYDKEYYIEKQILPSVEKILDVLGYKKKDLLGGGEQTSLGGFM